MLQGITDYLQLLCWHTVFGSALRASFTAFQLRKTGTFDRSALHEAHNLVAEVQCLLSKRRVPILHPSMSVSF